MERRQCQLFHRHFEFSKVQMLFARGKGNNFGVKMFTGMDEIRRERIKIIDLFLETRKSAGEFWVDAVT